VFVNFKPTARTIALTAYWACLLALFVALRLNLSDAQLNIDELIPVKVSEAMTARGALDPNWRFGDLPWFWNRDQYNFYFYNIVAHGVLKAGAWFGASALPALRLANVIFQLFALAFSIDTLRRLGVGTFGLALAGMLLAVAPGMVQDAGMARPESLIYLVVALQLWILTLPLTEARRTFLSGALIGIGSAIKVTYVLTASLLVARWAMSRDARLRRWLLGAVALGAGAVLGFAAAAPYATIHPVVFTNGLAALAETYNSGLPPHSLPRFDLLRQGLWVGTYFLQLYGPVLPAALAAPFLLTGEPRKLSVGFVVFWILVFVYFITKPVFFERNFSHALIPVLLAAALAVAALRRPSLRFGAAAVLALWMGYWSVQIAAAVNFPGRAARFEADNALAPSLRLSFDDSFDKKVPEKCETIALTDHNDPWTAGFLALLEAQGFRPIALYRGRFSALVTSTLHTYLDSDVHYLRCPDSKR
jgi:hypothetical protein